MSKLLLNENDFEQVLKEKESVFVLFYASWCPYSARFLPIFEKHAEDPARHCVRVVIDDLDSLVDKYNIVVYPTVIFFNKGKVTKRLDGLHGEGLKETQLKDFIDKCGGK